MNGLLVSIFWFQWLYINNAKVHRYAIDNLDKNTISANGIIYFLCKKYCISFKFKAMGTDSIFRIGKK